MKKLANGGGKVYCEMTPGEFNIITKQPQSNVPDGSEVSVSWIKKLTEYVDLNKTGLQSIAQKSAEISAAITEVLK